MYRNVVFLVLVLGSSCALQLPPEVPKCRRADPKIDECLKNAIQKTLNILAKGLPGFNFDSIEPIKIPSLMIGEGKGAVHVVQNYKNMEVHNISKAVIKNVKSIFTDDGFKLEVNTALSQSTLETEYNFNGNILIFPIVGNGTATIRLENSQASLHVFGKSFTKKQKKYVEITELKISLNPSKVEFDFRNLFNGDVRLGTEMNKLLNDNWKDVYDDVKHGYEDAIGAVFQNLANLIFKRVPFDNIFLV
ncbi:hypothetical protein RN001_011224 [Aquatica leii]|uniref:Uncharacterized protein n=1 Tax=Aquatica leii TaxID=1421715 RepID=A0AAN7QI02_9COLE|nr:hypothetical protein RN001_011224 [Aquatica leii]